MYDPVQDGKLRTANPVRYVEVRPPEDLSDLVHCFWALATEQPLSEDFLLHAIPDACVNILFNQMDTRIAGVTALHTAHTVLNLGKTFHYVGIQLFPGVWQGQRQDLFDRFVGEPYSGSLPLVETSQAMAGLAFTDKLSDMIQLVSWLREQGWVIPNDITGRILRNIERIHSVRDMAEIARLSARQLQRVLRQSTGFSPHDLLKVLRMQRAFRQHFLDLYADQSHFIHAFRKINGMTPVRFSDLFDV